MNINVYTAIVVTANLALSIFNLVYLIRMKGTLILKDKELLDAINDATNSLATRIAERDAKIKAAGELTPELEAEGQAIIATLNALASNPADPVPTPVESNPTV